MHLEMHIRRRVNRRWSCTQDRALLVFILFIIIFYRRPNRTNGISGFTREIIGIQQKVLYEYDI